MLAEFCYIPYMYVNEILRSFYTYQVKFSKRTLKQHYYNNFYYPGKKDTVPYLKAYF